MAVFNEDLDAAAKEREQAEGEGDGRPVETPAGSANDSGKPIGERAADAIGTARRAAKAAQKLGSGLGGNAVKLATTIFGPGSKIKIGIIVIDLGVFLLALIFFVIGLTTMSLGNSGNGGTTPLQGADVTDKQVQEQLKLLACLDEPSPTISSVVGGVGATTEEPAQDDGTLLSPKCQQINREQVVKAREQIAELRKQLPSRGKSDADRATTKKLLDQLEAELQAIDTANGKIKATREHVEKANGLAATFADAWSKLGFHCDTGTALVGTQSSAKPNLYQLQSHTQNSASPIRFYFDAPSRPNTYVSKEMACYLATLTVQAQSQLGIRVEVGDASRLTGEQRWYPHKQHGGGGNVDIWAQKVMIDRLEDATYDNDTALKLARLILDLGAKELFITHYRYPKYSRKAFKELSIEVDDHSDHWHICIHDC